MVRNFSKLINAARKTYTNNKSTFDVFLQNKLDIISYQNIIDSNRDITIDSPIQNSSNLYNNTSNTTMPNTNYNYGRNPIDPNLYDDDFDDENNNLKSKNSIQYRGGNMNNMQQGYQNNNPYANMSPINFIAGDSSNPSSPINIIAKNYINPDVFEMDNDLKEVISEHKSKKLAKIPDSLLKESATDWEPINYRGVNEEYILFDQANVKIFFDDNLQKLIYAIDEPVLTNEEVEILNELKNGFIYAFEKIAPNLIDVSGKDLISQGIKKLCSKYRIKIDDNQHKKLNYFLVRDFLGLEIIEPIMHDPYIEDVSCDGLNIPIFVNHLKYGPLEVNKKFNDGLRLNSFIIKLAQKANQEVSLSKPIMQGALPDGSRVEAIYGKEISEKGSSFTIRKFRAEPFTPIHLIEFGTMPPFLLAYLWLAVENKQSLLVSGGTATGKTTILNALSLFVPPSSKIISIEDTPEINLPHEHWLAMIARESEGKSEVTMFDLLKASLRERPDYIIVGEIRGAEAAILFQGMATGHAGLGTVHAEKFTDLVNRMTIAPINLPKQLLTEMNIVLFMKQVKVKSNIVRRIFSVVEIVDYNSRSDKFNINEFLKYVPGEDIFNFNEESKVISNMIESRGGNEEGLWNEIEKRRRILDFMHKNKIVEFREVNQIIGTYYKNPEKIFDFMEELKEKLDKENDKE